MNKQFQKYFFSTQQKSLNQFYIPNKVQPLQFNPQSNSPGTLSPKIQKNSPWTKDEVIESTEKHVVFTWGATDTMRKSAKDFVRGEGIYLIDYAGNKYIDWTSQAVSNNLGYTIPDSIHDAISKQLKTLPNLYGGLTISEPKAKLAQILNDITPSNITGFLFPCTGSDANEVAIRAARRFTGKQKILTRYKSYHGGSIGSLTATGDFRRQFAENGVSGFVKFFDFQAMQFQWGKNQEESINNYLAYLEELIINEGHHTVAAIMIETITGSGGVLINPDGVLRGIRSLCDKYKILLILDEVMVGLGRTGEFFSFQSYEGIVPDIFTCAKGISASFLPLSGVGFSKEIQDYFRTNALGWGTTFQAHPVSCVCGLEVIKYMIDKEIIQHVKKLEKTMHKRMEGLLQKHNCLRQGRGRGLFGAFDIVGKDGQLIQMNYSDPNPEPVIKFKQRLLENGIFMWVRAPVLHCAPPLIITESELNDGFDRLDDALKVMDH
ncbi:hypothetical protein IMG5_066220 [Ichthyophthirius multifiliis]|uniref:Uncharacterized protein n=1 Tax=Ichthyophthirius multifiliis TaxID=5932 RepID=G0QPC1_ICHMU|nr:hypothetical protein IMG5_066220 [Ichthyophthirius multifiliis]EGR32936.1 hypothetical protein IMG5_066220 [Ichthyophthirius multifiliis]|eukprot:XP_004036922.1 hypothetical protein IMG5_066220 [Ichthyophthirius multifiliis]